MAVYRYGLFARLFLTAVVAGYVAFFVWLTTVANALEIMGAAVPLPAVFGVVLVWRLRLEVTDTGLSLRSWRTVTFRWDQVTRVERLPDVWMMGFYSMWQRQGPNFRVDAGPAGRVGLGNLRAFGDDAAQRVTRALQTHDPASGRL